MTTLIAEEGHICWQCFRLRESYCDLAAAVALPEKIPLLFTTFNVVFASGEVVKVVLYAVPGEAIRIELSIRL